MIADDDRSYKCSCCSKSRKLLVNNSGPLRFGYLERFIIIYSSDTDVFALSEVALCYNVSCKRLHDAAKRLVNRGLLYRVKWGLYRAYSEKVKEIVCALGLRLGGCLDCLRRRAFGVGCARRRGCGRRFGVVRVHGFGGLAGFGLAGLLVQVSFACEVLRHVRRSLIDELLRVGCSRRVVRRLARIGRFYGALCALKGKAVYGAHGELGRGDRRLKPLDSVINPREVGVDIILPRSVRLPKFHVKIYTAEDPYQLSLNEVFGSGAGADEG